MADNNDRSMSYSGGGFMLGLLAGAVCGAGMGLLLASREWSETREQARNLGEMASDQYKKASDSANDWAERGREFVDKTREAVSKGADDAREYVAVATGADVTRS